MSPDVQSTDPSSPSTPPQRYRCTSCGNLTRFDVTTTRRTRAFHHYSVGGDLAVEDTEVLSEEIEAVVCRWCNSAADVVAVDDAGPADVGADDPPDPGA